MDAKEFIFLGGCEKVGQGATEPEGAFDLAADHKRQFDTGRGVTREYFY